MTFLSSAMVKVLIVFLALAGLFGLTQVAGSQVQPVCWRTDHPGIYPFVEITTVTGQKLGFARVSDDTVKEWDRNRLVVLGGQTRVPYDNIIVIDARCA